MRNQSDLIQNRMCTRSYVGPNLIKVTPFGYETLSNPHDWLSKPESKMFNSTFPQKIRFAIPAEATQQKRSPQPELFIHRKRQQSTRKAMRAYQKWTKSQSAINKNVQKELVRRDNQKSKVYEWNRVSLELKGNIAGILNKWSDSVNDEKNRVKERLQNIYLRRYDESRSELGKMRKKAKNNAVTGVFNKENCHFSADCSFL